MSTDRDTTRIVRSWLEEGATALPDRVLDAVLDQVPATRQRRAWWPARRLPHMNTLLGRNSVMNGSARLVAMVATLVGVVAIGAFFVLPRIPSAGVGGPALPASASAASLTPASTSGPTDSISQKGLTLDLTFSGPFINERLKTDFVRETDKTWCNWQASPSDPAIQFPFEILIDPQTVGGQGWSTFEFLDQDGPGIRSGELDLLVVKGAGRLLYKWAPGTETKDLSRGSATYSSDDKSVAFDVYAYDAKPGEQGYTHVTGSITCTP